MLVACCQLGDVANVSVQDRLTHNIWHTFETNTQLPAIVVTPRVHLTKLIDGEGVSIAAADLFDQLIFQGHQQSRVEYLEGLHGTHMLICDEVLQSKLPELVCAPRVKLAKNFTFLDSSDFFADISRVRVEKGSSADVASACVTSVRVLAHFVARESDGRGLRG